MRLGLFTTVVAEYNFEQLLTFAMKHGISSFEFSSKIGRGLKHFDPEMLEKDNVARKKFLDELNSRDIVISQLNCSCNPVSPKPEEKKQSKEAMIHAFRLAEKLGVDTIASFSGCPGGGPNDLTQNWITCSWPPEFQKMLKWQWEEELIPFWKWAAEESANYGVSHLGIEMHPGFCVYNPETLLKLREAVGPQIGANFDPSHLIWQGIDIPQAISTLKGAIWHFHAKDTYVDRNNVEKNGNIDTKHYGDIENRAWTFRTVGYGMSLQQWKQIISSLRINGYEGSLTIEHEDMLMSRLEGIEKATCFLKPLLFSERHESMWWA